MIEIQTGLIIRENVDFLGPDRNETLDVYLPPDDFPRPLPAVLLIHGGGWRVGDKASQREINIATSLARGGYAVFSINYLLNEGYKDGRGVVHTTKVAWPQNLYDCKSGLRYVRQYASDYGVDPSRIAVMGESAGGSMAMLLGATTNVQGMNEGGLHTSQSCDVGCVISLYGVFDLNTEHRRKIFAGPTSDLTDENVCRASPITWLHPGMPPILVVHGAADREIPVEESRDLVQRLRALNVPHSYVEVPEAGHSFDLQPPQMDLRPIVLGFLERHLKGDSPCSIDMTRIV